MTEIPIDFWKRMRYNRDFQGEPERVAMDNDIDSFTAMLWENLNADNKISLFVRYTDLETRATQQRILNKHN